jgi:hypothetical protein
MVRLRPSARRTRPTERGEKLIARLANATCFRGCGRLVREEGCDRDVDGGAGKRVDEYEGGAAVEEE